MTSRNLGPGFVTIPVHVLFVYLTGLFWWDDKESLYMTIQLSILNRKLRSKPQVKNYFPSIWVMKQEFGQISKVQHNIYSRNVAHF